MEISVTTPHSYQKEWTASKTDHEFSKEDNHGPKVSLIAELLHYAMYFLIDIVLIGVGDAVLVLLGYKTSKDRHKHDTLSLATGCVTIFVVILGLVLLMAHFSRIQGDKAEPAVIDAQLPSLVATSFNEDELVPYKAVGLASIAGRAYLQTGKDARQYADNIVYLIPELALTRAWFDKFVVEQGECDASPRVQQDPRISFFVDPRGCRLPFVFALDDRLEPYMRTARPKRDGTFTFIEVPSGNYLIATFVRWTDGNEQHGGIAHAHVRVAENEQATGVIVTRGEP